MSHSTAQQLTGQDDASVALREALVRLSGDVADLHADRRAAAEGRANLLHSLLIEIDETMLPRQLTLFFGQDAVAKLRVGHRRLLSLELTNDTGNTHPVDAISPAQTYAQQLQQLSAMYQNTGFHITRRACETGIETQSCSATQIADCLVPQAPQGSRLSQVLASVSALAEAWVLLGEDSAQLGSSGPETLTDKLTELARADKAAKAKSGRALRMPEMIPSFMLLTISGDTKVIMSWDQTETLLIALPAQQVPAANAAWHKVFSA
ncbi:hypothetical protein DL239_11090 [Sedimentitalea sp. CY04]|uniref:Uncharacterized protein n=1 Tax=Parasedimentitalea denitrificans TaxID=2211118 RepID=A0ABX0W780_9RHOB|nr:hypothetical protein [Sedimentitalea sp. CY04]NIZ61523.1 hypothetical protein [Sedimentitalea sp. CY04]